VNFFAPATLPWLLKYEMKMVWRGRSRSGKYAGYILLAMIAAITLAAGLPLAFLLRSRVIVVTPLLAMIADISFVTLFTLILSQTLSGSVTAFYERGDLDLLLSSPLPARRLLAIRCMAVTLTPMLLFAGLLTPFVIPAALLGHPGWLAAYGMIVALGLCAGAAGLVLAMALFAAIGARRTKTVGQLMAAFSGAAVFMLGQSRNMFPQWGNKLLATFHRAGDAGAFAPNSFLAWPLRALMGEPLPFLALLGSSLLLFALATYLLGARFASNAAAAVGNDSPRRTTRTVTAFHTGLDRTLIVKELRLLRRDPALLSQVLLRTLYVLPFGFILARDSARHEFAALAGAVGILTFITSQVSATLAWITISAEDAPDLIASAPISLSRARLAKLAAALLPVAALVALPLFFLIAVAPLAGLVGAVGVIMVSMATGTLNLWYQRPGLRSRFRQRGSGAIIVTIAETGIGMLGGVATGLAAYGSLWSILAIAVFGGVMVVASEMRGARH
jgi:ABC-2 type transport system permease protein